MIGFIIAFYLVFAKLFFLEYKMTERPLFYFGLLSMILGSQLFIGGFLAEMISRNASDRNVYQIEETVNS